MGSRDGEQGWGTVHAADAGCRASSEWSSARCLLKGKVGRSLSEGACLRDTPAQVQQHTYR